MNKITRLCFILLLVIGCSKRDGAKPVQIIQDPLQTYNCLEIGQEDEVEAMTWNLERFPLKGKTTVTEVSKLMINLDMDLIAIQEIKEVDTFNDMIKNLPHHATIQGDNPFIRLGFVYDKNDLELIEGPTELFKSQPREFPRSPLLAKFKHKKTAQEFTAINIHLKCCGGNDNYERRADAMTMLKTYLDANHKGENLIVLGDFNEHLKDTRNSENIYFPFIDSTHYQVTTLELLSDSSRWSYPSWLSQLDQIIVSKDFVDDHYETKSLQLDKCDPRYLSTISDHRPVFVRIKQ